MTCQKAGGGKLKSEANGCFLGEVGKKVSDSINRRRDGMKMIGKGGVHLTQAIGD